MASIHTSNDSRSRIDTEFNETGASNPETNLDDVLEAGPSRGLPNTANAIKSGAREGLPESVSLASLFRYHMGIENDEEMVPQHLAKKRAIDPIATGTFPGRRAVNLGIYNRAIREERSSNLQFQLWSIIINSALGLQIVFAAILTALGASNGSHDAVAIFGALNTVIAGFLTYLKGTGLPMRMKYFYNQWLKLRAYIEQRERDFATDDHMNIHRFGYTELMEEVHIIEKMYQNIRKDVERHTPDNFQGGRTEGNDAPGEGAPESTLSKMGLNAFKNKLSGGTEPVKHPQADTEGGIKGMIEDVESRIMGHLSKHLPGAQNSSQDKADYTATTERSIEGNKTNNADIDLEANREVDNSELNDMSEMELERMKQKHSLAQAAQYQAELKVKELEQKLQAKDDPGLEGRQHDSKDHQGNSGGSQHDHQI